MVTPDEGMGFRRAALACAALLLVGAASSWPGCTTGTGGDGDGDIDFDRVAMLENLVDAVILPDLATFETDADALRAAAAALDARAQTSPDDVVAELEAAREAWRVAMGTWQRLELAQVGPARPASGTYSVGQGLRDEIYSWPDGVNPCAVDQVVVSQDYAAATFPEGSLVTKYGLDALEYLLFFDGPDNQCAGPATINTDGSWAALSATDLVQRRAAYASAVADDVAVKAAALRSAWQGSFRAELLLEGEAAFYLSAADAVDDVFTGIFYLELDTKDLKLGVPAGIHGDCADAVCPGLVEGRWSGRSREHIVANLQAMRALLLGGDVLGGEGLGFDDFLEAAGAGELAATMLADLDAAVVAVQAIPAPLDVQLLTDPAPVEAAHAAVKAFTDKLRGQFAALLLLRVPNEADGDND